jgi:hypothetical protein
MRASPYFHVHWLVFTIPVLFVLGLRAGAWWAATGLFVLFVVIPILEVAFGRRTAASTTRAIASHSTCRSSCGYRCSSP